MSIFKSLNMNFLVRSNKKFCNAIKSPLSWYYIIYMEKYQISNFEIRFWFPPFGTRLQSMQILIAASVLELLTKFLYEKRPFY